MAGRSLAADWPDADKLAEVRLRDGGGRQVLVHIEIQTQRDPRLARRMRAPKCI